jgi:hypothetical protein
LLICAALLHAELCDVSLVFDNAEVAQSELSSKNEILSALDELHGSLSAEENKSLGVFEAVKCFENKFSASISVGDWVIEADVKVHDLKELLPNSKP